jgi:hypothetical protein
VGPRSNRWRIAINPQEVKLISLKDKDSIWEKILSVETGEKIYKKLMGLTAETPGTKPVVTQGTPTAAGSSTSPTDSGSPT